MEKYLKEQDIDEVDVAEIDAMAADCIIQYAVYGELVFG